MEKKMFSLLLLNGGIGTRIGADRPKQLLDIKGIPILVYALVAADKVSDISEIILNYPPGWRDEIERIVENYAVKTPVVLVEAGESRSESVEKALAAASNHQVIIHEAARPLVTRADFEELIAAEGQNVAYMLPISFTVAPVDSETRLVTGSLDRSRLRNVQLPQKFDAGALAAGFARAHDQGLTYTEEATMLADAGYEVRFIDGKDTNIKVTTPTDVRLATFLLRESSKRDD